MKKTRTLIVMVVILVVLIGAFALSQLIDLGEGTTNESTSRSASDKTALLSLKAEEIKSIAIENEDYSFELLAHVFEPSPTPSPENSNPVTGAPARKSIVEWKLSKPEIEMLDQEKVNALGNALLELSSIENIGKKSLSEAEEFGINDDNPHLLYTLNNGEKIKILLGKPVSSSGKGQYYAYNASTQEVSVVSTPAKRMLSKAGDLMNSQIISLTFNEIKDLKLKREMDSFEIHAINNEVIANEDLVEGENPAFAWTISEPIEWSANSNNLMNFIQEIGNITAVEFIPHHDNISQFGLDKPSFEIELDSLSTGQSKIIFGRNLSNELMYAMLEGSEFVFTVNRSSVSKLGMPAISFLDSFAALANIQDVKNLNLILDGEKVHSEIFHPSQEEKKADESLKNSYLLDGKNADLENEKGKNAFSQFYQAVIGVTLEGFELEAEPNIKDMIYEIEIEKRNGEDDIVASFVPRNETTLYLFREGKYTGLYVNKSEFDGQNSMNSPGIIQSLKALRELIGKQ